MQSYGNQLNYSSMKVGKLWHTVVRCGSCAVRWGCSTHFNRNGSRYVCICISKQRLPLTVTAKTIANYCMSTPFTWINVQHKVMVIMCTNQANWMLQSHWWCVLDPLHNQFTFGDPCARSGFKGVDFLSCDLKHKIDTDDTETDNCRVLYYCLVQFCNQINTTTTYVIIMHTLTLGL